MIRRTILLLLSLGFFATGAVFAWGEFNLAAKTGDQDHVYAALFGGGLFSFAGVLLLLRLFKPRGSDSAVASAGLAGVIDDTDDFND